MTKTSLDITLLLLLATMVIAVPHDLNQAWKDYKVFFNTISNQYILHHKLLIFILFLSFRISSVRGPSIWWGKILPLEKKSSIGCTRWLRITIAVEIAHLLWSTTCSQSWYNYKVGYIIFIPAVLCISIFGIGVDGRREERLFGLCSSINQRSQDSKSCCGGGRI